MNMTTKLNIPMRYDLEHSIHQLFKEFLGDWELPPADPSTTYPNLKPNIMSKSSKRLQFDPKTGQHKALMEEGSLIEKNKTIMRSIKKDDDDDEWTLLYGKLADASLHATAFNNHPQLTRKYILEGAFVNIRDHERKTALHICSITGHAEPAKVLIEFKADLNPKDLNEKTPLVYAFEREFYQDIKRYF